MRFDLYLTFIFIYGLNFSRFIFVFIAFGRKTISIRRFFAANFSFGFVPFFPI